MRQTRTARPRVQRINHKASAAPTSNLKYLSLTTLTQFGFTSDTLESNSTENAGVMRKLRHVTICTGRWVDFRANRTALKVSIDPFTLVNYTYLRSSTKLVETLYLRDTFKAIPPFPHSMLRVSKGGSLFPCSLPKLPYVPMFPHYLSECFRTVIFRNFVPCSQKLANFPLFPSIFC